MQKISNYGFIIISKIIRRVVDNSKNKNKLKKKNQTCIALVHVQNTLQNHLGKLAWVLLSKASCIKVKANMKYTKSLDIFLKKIKISDLQIYMLIYIAYCLKRAF